MAKRLPEKRCTRCKHYHCRYTGKRTGYVGGGQCPRRSHPCIQCGQEARDPAGCGRTRG